MRVSICDDDVSVLDQYSTLIKLIAENNEISIAVDRFEKGSQLLFAMEDKKLVYDIVFLDIFMPGQNGIDLGSQLGASGYGGFIVYLTRSEDHMLSAFDVGAVNYVIKGEAESFSRFEKVFLKVAKQVENRRRKYILLNSIDEYRNIPLDSIQYFEVNRHICFVHYGKGDTFEFSSSLGKLENTLLSFDFERVHRSFLVNCRAVESYTVKEINMSSGAVLPVGRKYSTQFRQAMADLAEVNLAGSSKTSE